MFEVAVIGDIAAAHKLDNYDGPCQFLHGHTWKVEAVVVSDKLDAIGMVADFKILKMKMKQVLDPLDHTYLNELPAFKGINPTTENLAKHIYRDFAHLCLPLKIKCVRVWESDTSSVTYYE